MEKVYSKSEIRIIFKEYSLYLKFNQICKTIGISYQAYYQFMKGNDSALSNETLERIWLFIKTL